VSNVIVHIFLPLSICRVIPKADEVVFLDYGQIPNLSLEGLGCSSKNDAKEGGFILTIFLWQNSI
jgi:hypothetical protein